MTRPATTHRKMRKILDTTRGMITRQDGCRLHQQDGGIAMLMRRIALALFIVGIVILTVLLLTPADYLPKVVL